MGYATIADVAALAAGRTLTATSKPSIDQVAGYLVQTSGVLDGILRARGHQVPIPAWASDARLTLQHYNALGGYALTERAAQSSQDVDAAERLWANAQKMLRDGQVELDAPRDVGEGRSRAPAAKAPFFARDQKF